MLSNVKVNRKKIQMLFKICLLSLFLMLFFSPVIHVRISNSSSNFSVKQQTTLSDFSVSESDILPNSPYSNYAKVSSWDINYGGISSLTIKDDIAFIGTRSGFLVLDVSNPSTPSVIYYYETNSPYWIYDILVTDNYAFVGSNNIYIFDISDINDIFLITKLTCFGMDLALEGDYLYAADGFVGLVIYNIAHIASPYLVKIHSASKTIHEVEVSGQFAYICKQTEIFTYKLVVINITNPNALYEVSSFTRPDLFINDITLSGNYIYMACGNDGLLVMDVSDPTNPTLVGEFTDGDGGYASALVLSGNYIYMAEGYECLEIISVATKSSPFQVGEYTELGEWRNIAIEGNTAYLGGVFNTNKLIIINCNTVASPTKAGEFSIGGLATGVYVSGNYVYVCNQIDGLYIIDITDILHPLEVGHFNDGLGAFEVCVIDDIAYIAAYFDSFKIVNCTDKTSPTKIAEYNLDDCRGITVEGNCAYVIDQTMGLYVFNISDPTSPYLISTYDEGGAGENVFVNGDCLYLAYGIEGLHIINISDPTNLVKLAEYSGVYCKDVCVYGNHAYLAGNDLQLVVLDVSDPENPVKTDQVSGNNGRGVYASDDSLFLSTEREGVKIFDLITPSAPSLVDTFFDGHYPQDAVVDGDYVFIAAYDGGLEIIGEDSDNDNLGDKAETDLYETNPNDSDSDDDQLVDGDEVFTYNTDPLDSDTDDDGLTDYNEVFTYQTDPTNDDTDRDGLDDGEEVVLGEDEFITNPKDKDTDKDGLTDYEEVNTYNTDPTDKDTDDDSFSDYDEIAEGTDPLDPDSYPGAPTDNGSFGSIISLVIISFLVLSSIAFIRQKKNL